MIDEPTVDPELRQILDDARSEDASIRVNRVPERVRERIARSSGWLGRLRAAPMSARVTMALVAAATIGAGVVLAAPRPDLGRTPIIPLLIVGIIGLFGLVGSLWLLLRPLHLPPLRRPIVLGTIAALGLLPLLFAFLPSDASMHDPVGASFFAGAVGCFGFGMLACLPLVAAVALLRRTSLPTWPQLALTGATAGIFAVVALQLHCPADHPAHLLVGHGLVGFGAFGMLTLVATLVGREP